MFNARIMDRIDVSYLDPILKMNVWEGDGNERLKLHPYAKYQEFEHTHIMQWAQHNSRYGLPTKELINWLKLIIGGRDAIEVGSGMGDLGYHLGIPCTDSFMQHRPEIKMYYALLNNPITEPPKDVQKLDAVEAVKLLKPKVVIGSWLTQYVSQDEIDTVYATGALQGNPYGVDEIELIKHVDCYIHIGNEAVHGRKDALKLPHEVFKPDWLVSRAFDQSKNLIYVWGN